MASPQKEDGYTAIANEIMDVLIALDIPSSQRQCLLFILRKTYGYNKKRDSISNSQFVRATGLSRRTVIYALQNLEAKRIIIIKRRHKKGGDSDVNIISFNKNYEKWVVQRIAPQYRNVLKRLKENYKNQKEGVVQRKGGSAKNGQKVVQRTENDAEFFAPTKDNTTKDNIQKTVYSDFDLFWKSYPRKVGKQACLKIWLDPKKKKLRPGIKQILKVLEIQKTSEDWTKENGRYIPNPATWLNQGRWDDELKQPHPLEGQVSDIHLQNIKKSQVWLKSKRD